MKYETISTTNESGTFWTLKEDPLKLHREDGPAVEWRNGDKEWWFLGQVHNEAGPAIIYKGEPLYYLNDKAYTKNQWKKEVKRLNSLIGRLNRR